MPKEYPWGMPLNFMPKKYQPAIEIPTMQHVMSAPRHGMAIPPPLIFIPPPIIHIVPFVNEQVYHVKPSECLGVEERMDNF